MWVNKYACILPHIVPIYCVMLRYCRITYFNQISYANIFYYMSGGGGSEGGVASLLDIYSHVFRTNWVITGFVNKYS